MFGGAPGGVSPRGGLGVGAVLSVAGGRGGRRLARLHGMGYDAYSLVGVLFNADERGMEPLNGATGQLFLTRDGKVHRELAWARFDGGKPVAMQETAVPGEPSDAASEFGDESANRQAPLPND